MKSNRGFTLIELLVVISIIGVLSSVIIVSLSAARDKGRVAGGLKFATYTYHAFGADAIGQWNFNETAGNALDISGNKRHLSPTTGSLSRDTSNTPNGASGSSLIIAKDGNYATVSLGGLQNTLGNFTVTAWVYPKSPLVGTGAIVAASNNSALNVPFVMYVNNTAFPGNSLGVCANTILTNSLNNNLISFALQSNKWNHVACSMNIKQNPAIFKGYVDGQQTNNTATFVGTFTAKPIDTISVGGSSQVYPPTSNMLIDDVAIYTQTLTASEIQHIYAQGAAKHGLAVGE